MSDCMLAFGVSAKTPGATQLYSKWALCADVACSKIVSYAFSSIQSSWLWDIFFFDQTYGYNIFHMLYTLKTLLNYVK